MKYWPAHEIYASIQCIKHHPGVPTGSEVDCPVWNQDKFGYLEPLMAIGMVTPSFKIIFEDWYNNNESELPNLTT